MVEELSSYGMKVTVSIWPQVQLDSENFPEMDENGYLARSDKGTDIQFHCPDGDVMFFDFTNPRRASTSGPSSKRTTTSTASRPSGWTRPNPNTACTT
jgi:hypothetical protein